MTKKKKKSQVKKKRFLGIVLKISLFFLISLFLLSVVISIPAVQTRIINKITTAAFEKIHHVINIDYINIRWFDTILMRGVEVRDTKNQQMVKIDRVILDFKLGDLIANNNINFDKAILQAPTVRMIKNAPNGQFNLNYFIDRIKKEFSKKKKKKKLKTFSMDEVVITQGTFTMFRPDREIVTGRFDQYHFTIEEIGASLDNFTVLGNDLGFELLELQCVDSATHLDIKDLRMRFLNTRQSMEFHEMDMEVGKSSISQTMIFRFEKPSSLKEFVDSVEIDAKISESNIYAGDLGQFVPSVKKYNEYFRLKGSLKGLVSRFDAEDIELEFGANSFIHGDIGMYGLPSFNETFINADLKDASIRVDDVIPYISEEAYKSLFKFGTFNFNGRFTGFPEDFVSNASFDTNLGKFTTDMNLKIDKEKNRLATYSGNLKTSNFNLGKFLGDTSTVQFLDMTGKVQGTGLTIKTAQLDLVSEIQSIGIKNYNYHNIKTDATLADEFFNGNLVIDDQNLSFTGNLSVDLRDKKEIIKVEANLGKANLQALNISKKQAFLSSNLSVDMEGLKLDSILGDIFLTDTYFEYDEKDISIDTLRIISERDSLSRSLIVQSSNFKLHMFGDFNFSAFFKDAGEIFKEYKLIFDNDSEKIKKYYADKKKGYSDYYYLDYEINISDINPFMNLFLNDFHLSPGTQMFGSFTGGPTKQIEIYSDFDKIRILHNEFTNNTINVSTSKSSDDPLVYARYYFKSGQQTFSNGANTKDLETDIEWDGNKINFSANIAQSAFDNYANISGNVVFLSDETHLLLKPSEIQAINKKWNFSAENIIKIRDKRIEVQKLILSHEDQSIAFNGVLSENPFDNLFVSVRNFSMDNLNPLVNKEFTGVANGFVDVKNFFVDKEINSRINIKDFTFNTFPVGDIIAYTEYDNMNKLFDVNFSVQRDNQEKMSVNGQLIPKSTEQQIKLKAKLANADVHLLEPFFENYISDVGGHINGSMDITGMFSHPVVKGEGIVKDGEFTLDYLNTHYRFAGNVLLDNNVIDFRDFVLTDSYKNQGILQGKIFHDGFKELRFDFTGDMKNFMVLNTTAKENELYYGTAFATGDLRIFGQGKIFNINATATSEKGTKIYIPLEGSVEVVQEDFISFVSKSDTLNTEKEEKGVNLAGLNLNFDFDLTPDAYCEIIFDITSGDIIRGRGNGKINLQIDTKGDFYMFGEYVIQEGGYNFTLYNVINKEFQIVPDSKITWIGDPYGAILDIQATYRQLASLAPIMQVTEEEIKAKPELNRKYPAKVILDIEGDLMYPEIEFDIDVEEYPKSEVYNGISLETQITAFRNKIHSDEQEMKRQVFSLIILKNFSPENAFNVGGSVGRSVSEFISNQISYWVTQFDENLEIDVDLGSLDDEAFNTFQLRMSYSFLDGRLRVTRDGGFTNPYSSSDVATILGDWSVEYMLTTDGKIRAKIYNKTNYNSINPDRKSTSTTAGFSLLHTQSFDELNSIFKKAHEDTRKKKEEKNKKSEENKDNTPESDSLLIEKEADYMQFQE